MIGLANLYAGMPVRTRVHEQISLAECGQPAAIPSSETRGPARDPVQQE